VKACQPDVFFTTVSYPIKGTPYFDAVSGRVHMSQDWAQGSDRDYQISGRRGRDYYRWADVWLRSEVEASRLSGSDPVRAATLLSAARDARSELVRYGAAS
jgi:anaerobic magnesium-protoporphyrin IX monomethyl ester cyclase